MDDRHIGELLMGFGQRIQDHAELLKGVAAALDDDDLPRAKEQMRMGAVAFVASVDSMLILAAENCPVAGGPN